MAIHSLLHGLQSVKLLLLTTVLAVWLPGAWPGNKCILSDGQCTYNVQLSTAPGKCNTDEPAEPFIAGTQNDYSKKMTDMERDLHDVKDDHESRLRSLENAIKKDKRRPAEIPLALDFGTRYTPGNVEVEERLMSELHTEFISIREKLRTKSEVLLATDKRLNDTLRTLETSQRNFLQTNRELLEAEDKLGNLQEENYVMKEDLEDKTEKLRVVSARLNETDESYQLLQISYNTTSESESVLKVQLSHHKEALNETTTLLDKTLKEFNDLIEKHGKAVETLKRREKELIDCYTAKTATFCGFEDFNICGFTQENATDFFNWTRGKGRTPSSNTGPDTDHTCVGPHGHFMYIEASSRGKGQNAILYSPKYRSLTEQCLEFYYHMYGRNVGTLNVYTRAFGNEVSSVWRAFGNQGNFWIVSRLYIPESLARAGYQIGFEAVTDIGFQGDIAIDDVRVNDGPCPSDGEARPVVVKVSPKPEPEPEVTPKKPLSRDERKRRRRLRKIRKKLEELNNS